MGKYHTTHFQVSNFKPLSQQDVTTYPFTLVVFLQPDILSLQPDMLPLQPDRYVAPSTRYVAPSTRYAAPSTRYADADGWTFEHLDMQRFHVQDCPESSLSSVKRSKDPYRYPLKEPSCTSESQKDPVKWLIMDGQGIWTWWSDQELDPYFSAPTNSDIYRPPPSTIADN